MFGSDALDQLYELKGTDLCSSLQKGEVQPKPVVISRIAIDARLPFPTSASLAHVIADFLLHYAKPSTVGQLVGLKIPCSLKEKL